MAPSRRAPRRLLRCWWAAALSAPRCSRQPIDGLFFTGSYGTGKKIAEAGRRPHDEACSSSWAARTPAYVADDVDVAAAAASLADGAMYNAGQSCCSVERIYVHEKVARPFIDAFVETVRGFTAAIRSTLKTYIGPLARRQQLEVLEQQVADAVAKGAKAPGRRRPRRNARGMVVPADRPRRRRRPRWR